MFRRAQWILIACLFSSTALAATGNITTLDATADAYVRNGSANSTKNYGTNNRLKIQTNAAPAGNYDTYLKFDLSSVGNNIASAKLRMYAQLSPAGSVITSAYTVSDTSWIESGTNSITWNNRPERGQSLGNIEISNTNTNFSWVEVDISSYVRDEKTAGKSLISIAMHDPSNTSLLINAYSREALSNKPQLVITENIAPTISITSPIENSSFQDPANISISASAEDSDGSIATV